MLPLRMIFVRRIFLLQSILFLAHQIVAETDAPVLKKHQNAYVTLLYAGTARDYEFYVATRVMLHSLFKTKPEADVIALVSGGVPVQWIATLKADGVIVREVENLPNPFWGQWQSSERFKYALDKLWAWSLTDYSRVAMLDADNLFLRNSDELFTCGHFCAVFINPCYFHTGLFVLEPSNKTLSDMVSQIALLPNDDGADQGFLISYYPDLLDAPLFQPDAVPKGGRPLLGNYRLPMGYQMDASYYYYRLRWHVPCSPNSVITFPGIPVLKPWYWWSWPVLPLGYSWHEVRRSSIGYTHEIPLVLLQALGFFLVLGGALTLRRRISLMEKAPLVCPCLSRRKCFLLADLFANSSHTLSSRWALKTAAIGGITLAFFVPFMLIPTTVHPVAGWGLLLLGSVAMLTVLISVLDLPPMPVLTPWLCTVVTLCVMAFPWYHHGLHRAGALGATAFLGSPFLWWALKAILHDIDVSASLLGKEPLMRCSKESQCGKSCKWAAANGFDASPKGFLKIC